MPGSRAIRPNGHITGTTREICRNPSNPPCSRWRSSTTYISTIICASVNDGAKKARASALVASTNCRRSFQSSARMIRTVRRHRGHPPSKRTGSRMASPGSKDEGLTGEQVDFAERGMVTDEIVHGLLRARAGHDAVVVHDHPGTGRETRGKEIEAERRGRIDVHVDVDEPECGLAGELRARFE